MSKSITTADEQYQSLINEIGSVLLLDARNKISREVNITMVDAYWSIGRYIVEYEQQGKERAEYGTHLLNRQSKDLTRLYGKGFGKSNLIYIRKLYQSFPISGTVSHLLGWSHYYDRETLEREVWRIMKSQGIETDAKEDKE